MRVIVVSCGSCGSRFRLDTSLLEGSKGARMRCRACGNRIVVMHGEAEEAHRQPVPGAAPSGEALVVPDVEDLFMPPGGAGGEDPEDARGAGKWSRQRRSFLVVAALLLIAAGLGYSRIGIPEWLPSAGRTPAEPHGAVISTAYEIREARGRMERLEDGTGVYIIAGTVSNVGGAPAAGVRILAALRGADNQVIAEGGSLAGSVLEDSLLRGMNLDTAREFLRSRDAVNGEPVIPAGGTLPFMVLFFDPPGPVLSFSVRIANAGVAVPEDGLH